MSDPFLGEIRAFGFNFIPLHWAPCDGQLMPITSNEALFSLLGTIYGGDGRTTFALPDLRGRSMVNRGRGPGLSEHNIGSKGGSEEQTLPLHSHDVKVRVADQDGAHQAAFKGVLGKKSIEATTGQTLEVYVPSKDATFTQNYSLGGVEVGSAGTLGTSNMPPFLAINFCIAIQGVYPSRP